MTVSFDLDGDVVLFAPHTGQLILLNPAASLLWNALADGMDTATAAELLAETAGIPESVASKDCQQIVAQWRDKGLLGRPGFDKPQPRHKAAESWWLYTPRSTPVELKDFAREGRYRIADFDFVLRSGDGECEAAVHRFLSHLAYAGDENPKFTLNLAKSGHYWQLYFDGKLVDECQSNETLVPMIHRNVMLVAYRASAAIAAVHAAALTLESRCVLLVGQPGSGKSTLTAALMADGFRFCSDDTVLLTAPPVQIRGVPMRLGIKEGSWPIVEHFWPEITGVPIHRREDGQSIRYFLPEIGCSVDSPTTTQTANFVIFPRYQEGSALALETLSKSRALMKLTEAGYDFADVVNEALVELLVDWVSGLACYEVTYGNIHEAMAQIRTLVKTY